MGIFNLFGGSEENERHSKITWKQLTNISQLDTIAADSETTPAIIFKHSTRCSISRMALKQFENQYSPDIEATPYFLDLLAHRDVSNAIAEKFNVMHQSPQLLLIKNGKSVYDASHSDIDAEKIKDKL